MRKTLPFENKWTGCALILLAWASFISPSAHGQITAGDVSSAPEHGQIRFNLDSR